MGNNSFENLPLPLDVGAGDAVDVRNMGALKTIVCLGEFDDVVIAIEASNDDGVTFAPVCTFQSTGDVEVVDLVAQYMRTKVSGPAGSTFEARVDVGAPFANTDFATIPMPVAPGAGTALDISVFNQNATFICTGSFQGSSIAIQISDDGGTSWTTIAQFNGKGGILNRVVTARSVRAFVSGHEVAGVVLAMGAASVPGATLAPTQGTRYFDDFISVANIATSTANGGQVLNNDSPEASMVGLLHMNGPATAAACIFPNADPTNAGFAMPIFNFGEGRFVCEWRLRWKAGAPVPGADSTAYIGVHDLPISGGADSVPSNGAFFQCGDALNGNPNWWARVTGHGDQAVDTGIEVSSNRVRLKVDVTHGGDSHFYIDDVLVATIAHDDGNTDGLDLTAAADVQSSAGSALNCVFDYYDLNVIVDRFGPGGVS